MRSFLYTNRTLWMMCGLLFVLVIVLIILSVATISECKNEYANETCEKTEDVKILSSNGLDVSVSKANIESSTLETFADKQISLEISLTECESDDIIPSFYTRIYPNGIETPVYAYTDQDGTIQYRSYAKRYFHTGNCTVKNDSGFINVLITFDGNKCDLSIQSNDLINIWEENPGTVTPELPTFGSIPNNIKYSGGKLFVYTDKEGEKTYCIYGSFDGIEYRYYECDENENMYPGSLYLDTSK